VAAWCGALVNGSAVSLQPDAQIVLPTAVGLQAVHGLGVCQQVVVSHQHLRRRGLRLLKASGQGSAIGGVHSGPALL